MLIPGRPHRSPMTDFIRGERLGDPDEEVAAFLSCFDEDRRIFTADLDVGRAHVAMLAEQGIVDEADAATILEALDAVEDAGFDALPEGHEDVHPAIEAAVTDRAGDDAGGRLHTARSRNDEVATCLRIGLRDDLLALAEDLLGLRAALVARADETADWPMSGYTHLQRAQPTTLGHHLLAHEAALARDVDRILDAYDRANRCPLGSAAFAGTSFPIDRERTAALLGFDAPTRNSMDGVASRDAGVEAVAAASTAALHASRLCEDLILWSTSEFGFVELDDGYSSTSSIMPQKKNPDTLELARGRTASIHADLDALLGNLRGQPMAYNRDLQDATHHVWQALDRTAAVARVLGGAVATAEFDEEALAASTRQGFPGATALADALVREADLPFRQAHRVVARLARDVDVAADVTPDAVAAAAEEAVGRSVSLDAATVDRLADPAALVADHDSFGGPGEVAGQLADAERRIDDDGDAVSERQDALDAADDRLRDAVEAITDG